MLISGSFSASDTAREEKVFDWWAGKTWLAHGRSSPCWGHVQGVLHLFGSFVICWDFILPGHARMGADRVYKYSDVPLGEWLKASCCTPNAQSLRPRDGFSSYGTGCLAYPCRKNGSCDECRE